MIFEQINDDLKKLLKEYSYFHDSIVNEVKISNPDVIEKDGRIIMQEEGDEISILINGQLGYKVEIKLHKTTGVKLFKLSNFIIFEIGLKKEDSELFFSLSGGFSENDIYFRCGSIEINEIEPLDERYRLR